MDTEKTPGDLVVLAVGLDAAAILQVDDGEHEFLSFGHSREQSRRQDFVQEAADAAEELGVALVVVRRGPLPHLQEAWELWGRWLAELEHAEVGPGDIVELEVPDDRVELPIPVAGVLAPTLRLAIYAVTHAAVRAAAEQPSEAAE
jgi:hypothetical protein